MTDRKIICGGSQRGRESGSEMQAAKSGGTKKTVQENITSTPCLL